MALVGEAWKPATRVVHIGDGRGATKARRKAEDRIAEVAIVTELRRLEVG